MSNKLSVEELIIIVGQQLAEKLEEDYGKEFLASMPYDTDGEEIAADQFMCDFQDLPIYKELKNEGDVICCSQVSDLNGEFIYMWTVNGEDHYAILKTCKYETIQDMIMLVVYELHAMQFDDRSRSITIPMSQEDIDSLGEHNWCFATNENPRQSINVKIYFDVDGEEMDDENEEGDER